MTELTHEDIIQASLTAMSLVIAAMLHSAFASHADPEAAAANFEKNIENLAAQVPLPAAPDGNTAAYRNEVIARAIQLVRRANTIRRAAKH